MYRSCCFFLCLLAVGSFRASAQADHISIRFIGNCGLHLSDGHSDLYIDFPYQSGAHRYMQYSPAELDAIKPGSCFLFTHRHADHYSRKLVKKLQGVKYGPWNIDRLHELTGHLPDFKIEAFKTPHKVYGIPFKHYSYLITWHGKKIYISGDTGQLDEIVKQEGMDWAFVNPWLYMTAWRSDRKIDAQKIGLYHLYPNQIINGEIPENLLILKTSGEKIAIPY